MTKSITFEEYGVEQWLSHLEALHADVIDLGLSRVRQVVEQMNLKPSVPVIIVGGTNGKGSTCAMIERIYAAAGYKTGVYSSPHLIRYHERVRINLAQVDDQALSKSFLAIEKGRGDIPLTYFEFGTLSAVSAFVDAGVDVIILEVGLGGRLDAVNVFEPDCTVITSIDLDHQAFLGNTREEIGFEKAGIFREGIPAICVDPAPPQSMIDHANSINAQWLPLNMQEGGLGYRRMDNQWNAWCLDRAYRSLPIPALRGSYQLNNATASIAAISTLQNRLPVSMGAIRRGLLEVELPGRFQVLPGQPQVIVDVGHNPHAARALSQNLKQLQYAEKTIAVCGMMSDKDVLSVIDLLKTDIDIWYTASLPAPRGASGASLASAITDIGGTAYSFDSPILAWQAAKEMAGERDRILVFGSFVTVGDVLTEINKK
ncbi:bifunctional tetrahydrofolate synthase/dihydrofolate synthase [Leeia sp. TBRC 13508]|uniref:Dihydrofolate synthase/folylpolyglutamate synthase n=1 Tax=Leeia speluncae TaxID=2884804 RepID=A0ABS8DAM0_9NEIS|nr:bifunctional tetrahydrofolate synthase/dihydrofolate synthase [Leeia speluncae]MCB6185257.1 bifunctional tetrahydrofolate synthase/dihydrofolate synthase [Leeia speluncae]